MKADTRTDPMADTNSEGQTPDITLYYAPRTRAFVALWLLEEIGVPYTLDAFDLYTGRQRGEAYRTLNPMGKVPLVVDRGRPVSETGAIALHLGDRYGAADLAPGIEDDDRAAFLRWLFFAGNAIEPAYFQKVFDWQIDEGTASWGSYTRTMEVLAAAVTPGPWLLGERFTLADVVIGNYLLSGMKFGMVEADSPLVAYAKRASARPAFARAEAIEARESARFPPAQA